MMILSKCTSIFWAICGIVLAMYLPPKPTAARPRPAKITPELITLQQSKLMVEIYTKISETGGF